MKNNFLKVAFILGAIAVVAGAFGAHALKQFLNEQQLYTYQTAVQYHFYHVIALAITGLLLLRHSNKWLIYAGYSFLTGLFLFCGSLYGMSFLKAAGIEGVNWMGAITPLGGLAFITGWLFLLVGISKATH
jgi:uncharacterized membrane protein YgdD (TMEM256/DUF423 family)